MKYSKTGDTRLTNGKDVVSFFKDYIEELATKGSLGAHRMDPLPLEHDAASGLGFISKDTPEFKEVYQHLAEKQAEMGQTELHKRAEEIVKEPKPVTSRPSTNST
jgi:hypothetical protein